MVDIQRLTSMTVHLIFNSCIEMLAKQLNVKSVIYMSKKAMIFICWPKLNYYESFVLSPEWILIQLSKHFVESIYRLINIKSLQ